MNYQISKTRTLENQYVDKFNNVGKVTKNTGIKKFTQRHVRQALKNHLGEQTGRYSRISPKNTKESPSKRYRAMEDITRKKLNSSRSRSHSLQGNSS